jgi:hypothetical protein
VQAHVDPRAQYEAFNDSGSILKLLVGKKKKLQTNSELEQLNITTKQHFSLKQCNQTGKTMNPAAPTKGNNTFVDASIKGSSFFFSACVVVSVVVGSCDDPCSSIVVVGLWVASIEEQNVVVSDLRLLPAEVEVVPSV